MSNIVCSPCLRDDITKDCFKYCTICDVNLCRECFRGHLKKFSTSNQRHHLIGRDEMPDWLISRQNILETDDKCQIHPDNELDTMCTDHDVMCCGACAVTTHRTCDNVMDLKSINASAEREQLMQECVSLLTALKSLSMERKQGQSRLRSSTATSLKNVRLFRKKINDRFDELERIMIDQLDTKCIEMDDINIRDMTELEKCINMLEKSIQELNSQLVNLNDVKRHRDNLNVKKLLNYTKLINEKIEKSKIEEVHFFPNKKLEKYITALQNIGCCSKYRPSNDVDKIERIELKGVYKTSLDVQDIVKSETGELFLADSNSKKIFVLDENYTIIRTHGLLNLNGATSIIGEPFSLCCISRHEVAVSLERDKLIAIIDVKTDEENQRCIKVDEYCRGICFNSCTRELFVTCGGGSFTNEGLGHIRVYSLKGKWLRSISRFEDVKTALLIRPLYLAISNDCSKMYVLDGIKGLVCISTEGSIIKRYCTCCIEDATGISVDMNDNILVACGNMVIRIANDMTSHENILDEENGFSNIQSICYDDKDNTCIVGCKKSHFVHKIQLT